MIFPSATWHGEPRIRSVRISSGPGIPAALPPSGSTGSAKCCNARPDPTSVAKAMPRPIIKLARFFILSIEPEGPAFVQAFFEARSGARVTGLDGDPRILSMARRKRRGVGIDADCARNLAGSQLSMVLSASWDDSVNKTDRETLK